MFLILISFFTPLHALLDSLRCECVSFARLGQFYIKIQFRLLYTSHSDYYYALADGFSPTLSQVLASSYGYFNFFLVAFVGFISFGRCNTHTQTVQIFFVKQHFQSINLAILFIDDLRSMVKNSGQRQKSPIRQVNTQHIRKRKVAM